MRVLDHIMTSTDMAKTAHHSLMCIDRGRLSLGRIQADIIVSHLAISWRELPMLFTLRAQHPRTPLIHVEHSYTECFVAANVSRKRRFATLLRTAYSLFNHVVAVSQAQGKWLRQSGAVRASALSVIPSCVDLSAFRTLTPAPSKIRVIGAIGRLEKQKGFDTLIKAFRNFANPDVSLHIYGEGAEHATLRDLAGNDPRIRFMGFAADPVTAMAAVDVVAMPSNWEAYGLVAIEALASDRYLLVNDIDGLSDHLAHGAQSVEDTSVSAWEKALEHLVQDAASLKRKRNQAHIPFESAFSIEWQRLLARVA